MLDFFAPVNPPRRQALRNQLHQLRGCPQRFAVSPESQPANSQHLLRRGIRAGNKSGGIHHQQPRRHIPRDLFAQPLGLFRALPFQAVQPFQLLFLFTQLLNHSLH